VKVKVRPQEFVIGEWQPGTGNRSGQLGSLLVGTYQDGALRYAGRVGTVVLTDVSGPGVTAVAGPSVERSRS
jgi:ATP-dependent DNA ligase